MSEDPKIPTFGIPEGQPATEPRQQPGPQASPYTVDTSNLSTVYTNFCHVTVTPEELILDFGLNTQMGPAPSEPIKLSHRVVMNYFTAKRLLTALNQTVGMHERAFGVLELDPQKRTRNPPRPGSGPGSGPGGARP